MFTTSDITTASLEICGSQMYAKKHFPHFFQPVYNSCIPAVAVHKAVVSKLPSPMRRVKDCVQANVYNNVNQKKKVMPSDKNKGWKTQNKELLVQSLSTASRATVARDLSIFNGELVVIC